MIPGAYGVPNRGVVTAAANPYILQQAQARRRKRRRAPVDLETWVTVPGPGGLRSPGLSFSRGPLRALEAAGRAPFVLCHGVRAHARPSVAWSGPEHDPHAPAGR